MAEQLLIIIAFFATGYGILWIAGTLQDWHRNRRKSDS